MSRRLGGLLAAAAVALTACGTTVSGADVPQTAAGNENLGVTTGSTTGSGTSGSGTSGGSSATSGLGSTSGSTGFAGSSGSGTTGATGGATGAAGGATGAAAGGSSGGGLNGNGVTAKAIYVGVVYDTSGDAANAALGAGGITQGDTQADAKAVIADINAHGGVAGRKLKPVWYDFDSEDPRPYSVIDQSMCNTFTQDHHVLAVIGSGVTDNFEACMAKAGVLQIDAPGGIIYADKAYYNQFPYYFNIGTLSQDRMMADEVRTLVRMGYFATGWNTALAKPAKTKAVIGILSFDTPTWERPLSSVLLPALARAGHPVLSKNIERIAYPSSNSEVAASVAQIQNAVLRFNSNHVSNLIVLDQNGSATLQMLQAMKSQHYYPRLGVNSATAVQALANEPAGLASPMELNGAVGLGWDPTIDLNEGKDKPYLTAATDRCIRMVEKRTGQQFTSTNAASIALSYCARLYALQRGLNAIRAAIDASTLSVALEAFGRFDSAGSPGSFFGPARHDAVEFGYDMEWVGSCSCVKYVGRYVIP